MADSPGTPAPSASPAPPRASSSWRDLHLWQFQPVRDILVGLAIFGIISLGYALSAVTVPLLLALTFAYLLEPLVARLTKRTGMSRRAAAVLLIVVTAILVITPLFLAAAFAAIQAIRLVQSLPEYWEAVKPSISEALRFFGADYTIQEIEPAITRWIEAKGESVATGAAAPLREVLRVILRIMGTTFYLIFLAFIVPFFFYFFCVAYPKVLAFGRQLIPDDRRKRALTLVHEMDVVISGFVRGRIVIALVLGVFHAVGWAICGVPAAVLLGLGAGLLSIIPFAIGLALPLAVGLLWLDQMQLEVAQRMAWWWIIGGPTIVYLLGQVLEGYILTPIIQGKATNLDAATIVAAVLAGGSVGGIYGALVAIPVAACAKILIIEVVWPRFKDWTAGRASDPLPIKRIEEQQGG